MKSRLFIILVLSFTTLLAACGEQTNPQASPTATLPPAPTQIITPEAGGVATAAPTPTSVQDPATQQATPQAATSSPTAPQAENPSKPQQPLQPSVLETNDLTRQGVLADEHIINLPPGFHIKVFAAGVNDVRWLGLSPEGVVYATSRGPGRILILPDADKDGVADSVRVFADGLQGVQGIAFKDGAVYAATASSIVRLEDTNKDGVADKRDTVANDLPSGSGHSTRTIAFGPDGKLYVSAGSSCNVCIEQDPKRAAISRYSADGKFEKVYASGLRNAVGIVFHPTTNELWATNNGRDGLGDEVPPETIYNIMEDTNYGWPFCYGQRIPDKTQNPPAGFCEKTGVPAVEMQAHSAPLGLAFYTGDQFPAEYKGDMFVAYHGSWNRSVPTGYKLVRVHMKDNRPDTAMGDKLVEDFATGWINNGDVWGRPVDPLVAPDGSLLLTDDKADAIYTIYFRENAGP